MVAGDIEVEHRRGPEWDKVLQTTRDITMTFALSIEESMRIRDWIYETMYLPWLKAEAKKAHTEYHRRKR